MKHAWFGALIALIVLCSVSYGAKFASIADFGCNKYSNYGSHFTDQKKLTSDAFVRRVQAHGVKKVFAPGDLLYRCGLKSVSDPQWTSGFTEPFKAITGSDYTWFFGLGNHDYAYLHSPESFLALFAQTPAQTILPSRYYFTRIMEPDVNISFINLDSSPCQSYYLSNDSAKWDPKTCNDGGEAKHWHEQVTSQSCADQAAWLADTLKSMAANYPNDVRVVQSHAPFMDLDTDAGKEIRRLLGKYNFNLYLSGHRHLWLHYKLEEAGDAMMVVNGCGCHDDATSTDFRSQAPTGETTIWTETPDGGFCIHEITQTTVSTRFINEHDHDRHYIERNITTGVNP